MSRFLLALLVISGVLFSLMTPVIAQGKAASAEAAQSGYEQGLAELYSILKEKEKEKAILKKRLLKEEDSLSLAQLNQELLAVDDVILGIRGEVVSFSTGGVSIYAEPLAAKEAFDWKKDLELIFEPLLNQLREVGERPRMIEKLEASIASWENRKETLDQAIINLTENLELVTGKALRAEMQELLNDARSRQNTSEQKLLLLQNDLSDLKESNNPIWTTLGDIFTNIIVGILLHFLIAIIAAVAVFQCVRLLSLIPIRLIRKKNPDATLFAERAIEFGRTLIGVMLMTFTYFVVLYTFGEWLLLVLSLLIIAGIILALKDTVPRYVVEIKALLNMGSIRQGERLIFRGLPWRISKLNVHTRLSNPELGASLRVPLSEIVNLSSRASHTNEPWFPSRLGDVVLLEDDVFGKVVRQTVDVVEVDHGGSIYTYQTTDFLARRPRNLSKNSFTIFETFGFDYQHQAIATNEVLKTYKEELTMAMKRSDYNEFNTFLTVEFSSAAASSLDFRIIARFNGDIASEYHRLKRFIQKCSVDIANKHGWVIPFQQLTVHHVPEK